MLFQPANVDGLAPPPTVSIIMTTYNRSGMIKDAIQSVMAQTFNDWELTVIDDGSTDATRQIVESFCRTDDRIRYVYQDNQGLSKSRARGVSLARGQYMAFLDDDDLYLPQKLERQVRFLDQHPEYGAVYSYVDVIDGKTEQPLRIIPPLDQKPAQTFLELIQQNPIQSHSVLVRRICFERLGGPREDLNGFDDYEMWLRLSRAYPIAFLPEHVGVYRWHDRQMSKGRWLHYNNLIGVYRLLLNARPSLQERQAILRRCSWLAYDQAEMQFDAEAYRTAAKLFIRAVRYRPLVGLAIPWGKSPHWVYRVVRPYMMALNCWWRALSRNGVQHSA